MSAFFRTRKWLLLLGVVTSAIVAEQNIPTFEAGVFLIHVDAEVSGQDRRPLTGLTKDDFRVLDGGTEQPIVAFSEGEQPLDLVLVFDISRSMRKHVKAVAAVANDALGQLRQGDRVSVMVFNDYSRQIAPFSDDLKSVEEAIQEVTRLHFGGLTYLQDSVHDAADSFSRLYDRGRRRAVLVVTDNIGNPSRHKMAVLESLWEADALLSGLVFRSPVAEHLSIPRARKSVGITDFVEQTGGDLIRSDDLSASFPEMMHRIRNRYTLYYKLPKGQIGSLRKIDVQLSAKGAARIPNGQVIARKAYRLHERDQYGFAVR